MVHRQRTKHCMGTSFRTLSDDGRLKIGYAFPPVFSLISEFYFSVVRTTTTTSDSTALGPKNRLPAGSYIYKTWFTLPQNLPASDEFGYGHICYEVEVRMELPWKFDVKDRSYFHIVPHYDLNEFPHLREPVWAEKIQTFGFSCWRQSQPMRMYISLPRCGFMPGDRVQCKLIFQNDSAVAVHTADVKLVEIYKFGLGKNAEVTCHTLGSHKFTGDNGVLVPAMQSKECAVYLYFNPLWCYRYVTGCQIITVEYYVVCRARTSIWHADLSNRTRIHVGTVPLKAPTRSNCVRDDGQKTMRMN